MNAALTMFQKSEILFRWNEGNNEKEHIDHIVCLFPYSVDFHCRLWPGKNPTKTAELITQGKKLYQQDCLPCHGDKGDGKGPAGAVLQPPANDFTKPLKEWPTTKGDPQKVFEVISKGIPNTGMVAWTQFPE
jgi:Cytochrome C oxidase, cbb3-type, subunit III